MFLTQLQITLTLYQLHHLVGRGQAHQADPDILTVTHSGVKVDNMDGGKEGSVEGHNVDAEKQFYPVKLSGGCKPGSQLS